MIKNKDNGFIGKAVISLIATLGTLALFMGTSGVSADVKEAPKLDLDANQTKAQTLDPDLLNEILAQTSEVGEYQIYVKNADELLISGPVPIQTANEDVNYPNLESSLNSASIYLGQKNRYELANEEDAQSGLALVEE